ADDVHAELNAFIADEHRWAGDELAHLVLALAAERAVESVFRLSAGCAFAHTQSFTGLWPTFRMGSDKGSPKAPRTSAHNEWLTAIPFKNVHHPTGSARQLDLSKDRAASRPGRA